jgi:hypothetical protein
MAIARDHGLFEACVAENGRMAANGNRCDVLEYF